MSMADNKTIYFEHKTPKMLLTSINYKILNFKTAIKYFRDS